MLYIQGGESPGQESEPDLISPIRVAQDRGKKRKAVQQQVLDLEEEEEHSYYF